MSTRLQPPKEGRVHAKTSPLGLNQFPAYRSHDGEDAREEPYSSTVFSSFVSTVASAGTENDLALVIVNETRRITGAQQIFLFSFRPFAHLDAISGLPRVNRQSPLVKDLEEMFGVLEDAGELDHARMLSLGPTQKTDLSGPLDAYPFPHLLWTPVFIGDDAAFGVLYARSKPWKRDELELVTRCAGIFSRRAQRLKVQTASASKWSPIKTPFSRPKQAGAILAVLLTLGLCMPTTMMASAPFQVVSQSHLIVAAPLEGVVERVFVEPGEAVVTGQPLVKFVDVAEKNQVSIARRQVEMSEALLRRANQMSFEKQESGRELGPSLADVAIKRAELNLAMERSARTTINAEADGVAVFTDEKSLIGRPFSIGERVLEIADPDHIEFEILLDVSDSISLTSGMPVKLFPDAAPLHATEGRISQISYLAEQDRLGRLSYKLIATTKAGETGTLRLGTTGTAKIYGQQVPLALYLFRRPIASVRQWFGL
ncbi:HlyD family efflux transporter periplasmic adaptor subunit [Rhizobium sp. AQ_MP]|uniref:efflux RND transporter periplasmic adaptor subunit n=1 Tax=Rhizobium sp. AQ_MP TaxID=2761536 RepID=UPI0016397611|nr:HlyD family efflux transporter periplasmic adaptor subunit [Rhizobium sp. AQ_MP]MBC2775528.1 HlyD family efflux transporter periplasmic adaptor subunit [Rhizobium sp. AQ_MP]